MKLAYVRRVRRLSVDQLASLAGVSANTIRNIEAGKRVSRMETAHKLEKALSVNGQMIEEFWPVLGEPNSWLLRQRTPEELADSILQAGESIRAVRDGRAELVSLEELRRRAKASRPEKDYQVA